MAWPWSGIAKPFANGSCVTRIAEIHPRRRIINNILIYIEKYKTVNPFHTPPVKFPKMLDRSASMA
jgi:hypothetical protein